MPSFGALAARFAVPLAGGLLLALFAVYQADRVAAGETAYLALWMVAALLPAAAIAPAPAREAAVGTILVTLAAWALPAGPARAAAVGAILVAAVALAAARALAVGRTEAVRGAAGFGLGNDGRLRGAGLHRLALTVPLALAAQALLRGELLLAPDASDAVELLALPVGGALALAVLAAHAGPAALLAGAAAVALGPGWTATTTLALAGVAAGAVARGWFGGSEEGGGSNRGARAVAALALGLILAAGLATETRAAVAALAGAAIVAMPRPRRFGAEAMLLLAVVLPAATATAPLRSWAEALALVAWVPILVPAVAWAPALPRSLWPPVVASLGLGLAGALAVPGPAAPAAAVAALAVVLFGDFSVVMTTQAVWSSAVLAAAALLAAYPWLRPAPAVDALALVGLEPGWRAALVLAAAVVALGFVGLWATRSGAGARLPARLRTIVLHRPALLPGALLAVAVFAALPPPAEQVFSGSAVLGPGRQRMAIELGGSEVGAVAVFSNLSSAAGLAAGTEVATLRLLDADGETLAARPLRAGVETGEWAARRPDVAVLPDLAVPPPWTGWVESPAAAGTDRRARAARAEEAEPFFGQLYRAAWTIRPAPAAARLVIERAAGLPREVSMAVHRVEVAR